MIEYILLISLGFLVAGFLALLLAIPFWRRAVRLTTRRLQATMPMSIADIQAEKDQLRAEYAVKIRRREIAREKEREKAARYLVERNRNQMTINTLQAELKALSKTLAERANAGTVLERTIQKRIPELEAQLERARQIIAARDRELARLKAAYDNQTEAAAIAKKAAQRYNQELGRLREALEGGVPAQRGKRRGESEIARVQENQKHQAELSRLRQQIAEMKDIETADNALLRSEMHKLAKQMMDLAPAKPAPTEAKARDERPVAAPVETKAKADGVSVGKAVAARAGKTEEKEPARPAAADQPEAASKQGKRRLSLAERLRRLRPRAQA